MTAAGPSIVVSGMLQLARRLLRDAARRTGGRDVGETDLQLAERVIDLDTFGALGLPPARWTRTRSSPRSALADDALRTALALSRAVEREPWAHAQAAVQLAGTLVQLDRVIVGSRGAELPAEWAPRADPPTVFDRPGRHLRRGGAPS